MIDEATWAKATARDAPPPTPLTKHEVEGVRAGYLVTRDGRLTACVPHDAYASRSLLKEAHQLLAYAHLGTRQRSGVNRWWEEHGLATFAGKHGNRLTFRLNPLGREFCELMVAGR